MSKSLEYVIINTSRIKALSTLKGAERMSEKRRDNKGRILRTGESQRKDGRYLFKYVDSFGKTQCIYSWKLVATDRLPQGKRDCVALRDKEREILKDLHDGIDTYGKKITLCQLYEKQNMNRSNVRENTKIGRKHLMSLLKEDKLGARSIDSIKLSDCKEWALRMKEKGYSYKTISNYKRSLKASFYIAIQDDYVRRNPFDFALSDVLKDDTEEKQALSEEQEQALLDFAKSDKTYKQYYNAILILLRTGLRISELCGLTVKDIDFESETIHVTHQLLRNKKRGYYIEEPKTQKGKRDIPMSKEAKEALYKAVKEIKGVKQIEVDGYSRFLFLLNDGKPMTSSNYTGVFRNLVNKYNKIYPDTPLPKVSPHTLRHTFCSRLASKNINPKNLQSLMGHSNINITLNLYAHTSQKEIRRDIQTYIS